MTILHLKERVKKKDINRVSDTKVETGMRFLYIANTCNTLVNSKRVGRELRVKEPVLAIDKPIPSPIRTRSEAMYNS